jgi:hypothetical protein
MDPIGKASGFVVDLSPDRLKLEVNVVSGSNIASMVISED